MLHLPCYCYYKTYLHQHVISFVIPVILIRKDMEIHFSKSLKIIKGSKQCILFLIFPRWTCIISFLRCCCGRLIAEHVGPYSGLLGHDSADEEEWSVLQHTSLSPTDAFGSLDFQGSSKRACRAKVGVHKYEISLNMLIFIC